MRGSARSKNKHKKFGQLTERHCPSMPINVRFWHKADIPLCTAHVRYWGQSGHAVLQCKCPLLTQIGHWLAHVTPPVALVVFTCP
jgi:hypothetical protein